MSETTQEIRKKVELTYSDLGTILGILDGVIDRRLLTTRTIKEVERIRAEIEKQTGIGR